MTTSYFQLLLDHDHWATLRVINTLHALPEMPPKAEALMNHILGANETWHSRVVKSAPRLEIWESSIPVQTYREEADYFHSSWTDLIAEEGALNRTIIYRNSKGTEFRNTLWQIITHLTMHSQYHRGQIITAIRPMVDNAPATDMIVYMRESSVAL